MADILVVNDTATSTEWLQVTSDGEMIYSDTAPPPVIYIELRIAKAVELYGGGCVVVLGVFGGVMSLLVLRRKKIKKMTMSIYLSGVAICDLGILILGQVGRHWFRNLSGVDLAGKAEWYCIGWMWLGSFFSTESSFLLAGVSVERCLAVAAPLKSLHLITRKSAYTYLTVTSVLLFIYFSHFLWSIHLVDVNEVPTCSINTQNVFAMKIRVWLEFFLAFAIPGLSIVVSSIVIIFCVIKAKLRRDEYLTGDANDKNQTRSTVAMLVAVSLVYTALVFPVRVAYFFSAVFPGSPPVGQEAAESRLLWSISLMSLYVNHAINFYVYIISGTQFRREFMSMMTEALCRKTEPASPSNAVKFSAESHKVTISGSETFATYLSDDT